MKPRGKRAFRMTAVQWSRVPPVTDGERLCVTGGRAMTQAGMPSAVYDRATPLNHPTLAYWTWSGRSYRTTRNGSVAVLNEGRYVELWYVT